jgi:hypothetical protein
VKRVPAPVRDCSGAQPVVGEGEIHEINHSPERPGGRRAIRYPTNTIYEDTLQALEDRFGDQHFAAAYRCQLTTRTPKAGESLQDFAKATELLVHRAYPTLTVNHIGRAAAKAFVYGVEDTDVKIQLLLGGEKTVNEALRQALGLQAVLVAARPHKNNTKMYRGSRSPPTRRRNSKQSGCCNYGEPCHFGNNCPYERKTDNKWRQKHEDTRESPRRSEWRPSNNEETNRRVAKRRETSEGRRRRAGADVCTKAPHQALTVTTENIDPTLVTHGSPAQ